MRIIKSGKYRSFLLENRPQKQKIAKRVLQRDVWVFLRQIPKDMSNTLLTI